MFKLEAQIFITLPWNLWHQERFFFLFSPISNWQHHEQSQWLVFTTEALREENCLKAGNLPGSKASLGVVLFYSLLFCCLHSFSSMHEQAPSRANNLSCWSFFLNWQNVLALYCYNLMFPEHTDVSIYTKAKWVWKKCFALGAGGSEVCGTLHLNVSSCKIGSVGKQLRKAP